MIRKGNDDEIAVIADVINDGASAYKGVIPADRWQEPYMPMDYLTSEIEAGVKFWVDDQAGELVGVMGVQDIKDVTLIRHAYVRTAARRNGSGSKLLTFLQQQTSRPLLIGTWTDATWAIDFYKKHGFRVIAGAEKDTLLKTYWSLPRRQIEESVVLADQRWFRTFQLMKVITKIDRLPATAGAYALLIQLKRRLRAWPSSGPILFPGLYLYAGSADGPGGIRARVRRHARHNKPRHWHVDRLTGNAPVIAAAALPNGIECDIVEVISVVPGVAFPAPNFGSSDCGTCTSHLLALPSDTCAYDLSQRLTSATWWWRNEAGEL